VHAQFQPLDDFDIRPEAPIRHLVRDGMLLATAGVRMAIKNRIIVRALRDHVDFDETYLIAAAQREFLARASETFYELERVDLARTWAKGREGRPTHNADYRRADLPTLKRRAKVLARLAEALSVASQDDELAGNLIGLARQAALDEIIDAASWRTNSNVRGIESDRYLDGLEDRKNQLHADLGGLANTKERQG
jgi:hypothetical protein